MRSTVCDFAASLVSPIDREGKMLLKAEMTSSRMPCSASNDARQHPAVYRGFTDAVSDPR